MEISFNSMDDDRWWCYDGPVLLLIDNTIHEATFESGRSWFYLYNNWNFEGKEGLEEHIHWYDERINGWAFCNMEEM